MCGNKALGGSVLSLKLEMLRPGDPQGPQISPPIQVLMETMTAFSNLYIGPDFLWRNFIIMAGVSDQ